MGISVDPQGTAESLAATALAYGAEAWKRILMGCDRVVVGMCDRVGWMGGWDF